MTILEYALEIKEQYNFNIIPLRGKRPTLKWEEWQQKKQTLNDLNTFEWNNATGIAAIMGIDNLRCLDIDGIEDYDLISTILESLGLGDEYKWVVQSGSGEGFHIYFYADDSEGKLSKLFGDKSVYKFKTKDTNKCKHIELRWDKSITALPPSMHESGGIYNFYFDKPEGIPENVNVQKLADFIEANCIVSNGVENNTLLPYYDKTNLESALNYLSQNLPEGSYDEWYKIGFALVPLGGIGEEYFINMSINNKHYNDTAENIRIKFRSLIKDYDSRINLGTIFHIAEIYGWRRPLVRFWYVDDKHNLKISRARLRRYLSSEGFCKYRVDSKFIFIRVKDNIAREVDHIDVKEAVVNYVENIPAEEVEGVQKSEIMETLIRSSSQIFNTHFMEFFITKDLNFNKDTNDTGYFYYQNGYVEVTVDKIKLLEYVKLEKIIWDSQILQRNYSYTSERSDFEELLHNISMHDRDRFRALKSSIGYLLHRYRDPSNAKAIIYIDEKNSDAAYGRSGKGLAIKAISKVRKVIIEDGRNFNPSKNFAFQRVNADTEIIAVEDMAKNFPFKKLFSTITEGVVVEKKNKDEVHFPFSESPKFVISSNYSPKGIDDSSLDRQFIVEFSDFYNRHHKPIDDFGKLLFSGWDEDDWLSFDNFMIESLQTYLREGLISYEHINLETKQLIDETCEEFAEFVEDLDLNIPLDKKVQLQKFKNIYEEFDRLAQSQFTRWIKMYARIKGFGIIEKKSGSIRTIELSTKSEPA